MENGSNISAMGHLMSRSKSRLGLEALQAGVLQGQKPNANVLLSDMGFEWSQPYQVSSNEQIS